MVKAKKVGQPLPIKLFLVPSLGQAFPHFWTDARTTYQNGNAASCSFSASTSTTNANGMVEAWASGYRFTTSGPKSPRGLIITSLRSYRTSLGGLTFSCICRTSFLHRLLHYSTVLMPICTNCSHPTPYLYTVYNTANNLRLEQCVSQF